MATLLKDTNKQTGNENKLKSQIAKLKTTTQNSNLKNNFKL